MQDVDKAFEQDTLDMDDQASKPNLNLDKVANQKVRLQSGKDFDQRGISLEAQLYQKPGFIYDKMGVVPYGNSVVIFDKS